MRTPVRPYRRVMHRDHRGSLGSWISRRSSRSGLPSSEPRTPRTASPHRTRRSGRYGRTKCYRSRSMPHGPSALGITDILPASQGMRALHRLDDTLYRDAVAEIGRSGNIRLAASPTPPDRSEIDDDLTFDRQDSLDNRGRARDRPGDRRTVRRRGRDGVGDRCQCGGARRVRRLQNAPARRAVRGRHRRMRGRGRRARHPVRLRGLCRERHHSRM